jgi:hypothetical protein
MQMVRFLGTAALALTACNNLPQGMGTQSGIIVLAPDSVWAAVGDSMLTALEPRIFTVRDERTFEVTHVSPLDPAWHDLRRFRQIVTIGGAEDGWVQPALRRAGARDLAGGVAVVENVWARNQMVYVIAVQPAAPPDAALPWVEPVAESLDSIFRSAAIQRMYLSRPDTALRDSLVRYHGFGLLLPNVYRPLQREPDVNLFQSSTQVGGTLVRSVLILEAVEPVPLTAQAVLDWRARAAAEHYRPAHITLRERTETRELAVNGVPAIEVQGVWEGTDPGWPMGGPFMARVYRCPAGTFLVDTWLYAPGRPKYEFMIQLETLLDTFECGVTEP